MDADPGLKLTETASRWDLLAEAAAPRGAGVWEENAVRLQEGKEEEEKEKEEKGEEEQEEEAEVEEEEETRGLSARVMCGSSPGRLCARVAMGHGWLWVLARVAGKCEW